MNKPLFSRLRALAALGSIMGVVAGLAPALVATLPAANAQFMAAQCAAGINPWASGVVSSNRSTMYNGSRSYPADRGRPEDALGAPNGSAVAPLSGFYSLGYSGDITLRFDVGIANGVGADVRVYEASPANAPLERADVYASVDGINWTIIGTADNTDRTGGVSNTTDLDLGSLSFARYIKLIDRTPGNPGSTEGFDLSAVQVLNCGFAPCPNIEPISFLAGDKDGFGLGLVSGAAYANLSSFIPGPNDGTMDRPLTASSWGPDVRLNSQMLSANARKPSTILLSNVQIPAGTMVHSAKIIVHTADIDDRQHPNIDDLLTLDGQNIPGAFDDVLQMPPEPKHNGISGFTGISDIAIPVTTLQQVMQDGQISVFIDEPTRQGRFLQDGEDNFSEIFAIDYVELVINVTQTNCGSSSSSSSVPLPQCSDGIDNADPEDTVADTQDPGCYTNGFYNAQDNDETNQMSSSSSSAPLPQCSDGIDNADPEDTLADSQDPGCYTNGYYNPNDNDETNQMSSSSSSSSMPYPTTPQCADGYDNDYDGLIDSYDPGCFVNGQYNAGGTSEANTSNVYTPTWNNWNNSNNYSNTNPQGNQANTPAPTGFTSEWR